MPATSRPTTVVRAVVRPSAPQAAVTRPASPPTPAAARKTRRPAVAQPERAAEPAQPRGARKGAPPKSADGRVVSKSQQRLGFARGYAWAHPAAKRGAAFESLPEHKR